MPRFSQPGAPGDPAPPTVRLGTLADGGLAPAIMAIVERGVSRRPDRARALGIEVELRMEESYPPVRIVFGSDGVLVEDRPARARAALGMFASRRVRIQGGLGLMRSFLGVIRL